MLPFSLFWVTVKSGIIVLMLYFITIFLTIFLLVGCYSPSQMGTYLSKFEFHKESPIFPMIKNSFLHQSYTTGLEGIVIKMGYLHTCVDKIPRIYNLKNETISSSCYSRKGIVNEPIYKDVTLQLFNIPDTTTSSNSSTIPITLNLLELAHVATTKIVHPHILIATIVFNLLVFLTILYYLIPFLPFKSVVRKVNLVLSTVLLLLWSFGVMWQHVASRANTKLLTISSLGIIKAHRGLKAAAMSWTAFVFLLVNCIILWSIYIVDRRVQDSDENLDYNFNYSTDSSSAGDKL